MSNNFGTHSYKSGMTWTLASMVLLLILIIFLFLDYKYPSLRGLPIYILIGFFGTLFVEIFRSKEIKAYVRLPCLVVIFLIEMGFIGCKFFNSASVDILISLLSVFGSILAKNGWVVLLNREAKNKIR